MGRELEEARDLLVPLLVMREGIYSATLYQPTAAMLPLSLAPGFEQVFGLPIVRGEQVFGLPIVRGDRVALIYEPPRSV